MSYRPRSATRIAVALGAAPLALAAASAACTIAAERRDALRHPPPGETVDVGGRRMHVYSSGTSSPALVVIPALSTPAVEWVRVHRILSERTDARIILVDRAGTGWSDPGPWPRTISVMADEIHDLITALDITGPLVLAGHSVGGLIARLYAARHRELVARLVLVDSSHEDQFARIPQALGGHMLLALAVRRQLQVLGMQRLAHVLGLRHDLQRDAQREAPEDLADAHLARCLSRSFRRTVVQECLGVRNGLQPLRTEARELGDLPLTVVTAGPHDRETWHHEWLALQREFLDMSTDSRQIAMFGSGHHINHDDPAGIATILHKELRFAGQQG
ncbi:alpha/beta hydrolase [Amycolatopsis sp. NPDC004079]|uniref:alpha/beta fold hydrolase n=1 Tax=Amycolatopsis sp. NPDC004079 TaxID=3154549 RepID=UPI0033B900DE